MKTPEELRRLTASNGAFSKTLPGLQTTWDTVSSGLYKECPRKYELRIIEGWTKIGINPHLMFGLLYHSSIGKYDSAIAKGKSHDEATVLAVRHAMEKTVFRLGPREICNECKKDSASQAPHCEHCGSEDLSHCEDFFLPWISTNSNKTRKNLVRTIVWYLETFRNVDEKVLVLSDGSPAVELWFRFEIDKITPDGTPYVLTGHIDKIVEFAGEERFKDLKTTKNTMGDGFFNQFSPDNQMYFYAVAGNVVFHKKLAGGVIDGVQVAVGFSRFRRGYVDITPAQLDEWLVEFQLMLGEAENSARLGHWRKNDMACHHYGGCEFRGICNKDPAIRGKYLRTHFKRQVWDPTKERKD